MSEGGCVMQWCAAILLAPNPRYACLLKQLLQERCHVLAEYLQKHFIFSVTITQRVNGFSLEIFKVEKVKVNENQASNCHSGHGRSDETQCQKQERQGFAQATGRGDGHAPAD